MRRPFCLIRLVLPLVAIGLLSASISPARAADVVGSPEFGVMANSLDMRRRQPAEVAAMMRTIGYRSVALSCKAHEFDDQIRAYRDAGIRVGAVYVGWKSNGKKATYTIPIDTILDRLRGTGAVVMVNTPSAKKGRPTDEQIVSAFGSLAKAAEQAGVTVAIYPHVNNRLATFEQAVRIADAVDHPSLGVSFNVCHFLRQHDPATLAAVLRTGKERLKLVTICGAAVGDTRAMDWKQLIQPIDRGEFDLARLLDLLCGELRFQGPIFVQCYKLEAPARQVLQDTFDRWQELKRHCRGSAAKQEGNRRTK